MSEKENGDTDPPKKEEHPPAPQPATPRPVRAIAAAASAFDLAADVLLLGGRDGPAEVARTIAHLLRLANLIVGVLAWRR